jgi:hypothetical protein
LEVLIVVEATMEKKVLKIGKAIKGFWMKIGDLQIQSTLGIPP